MRTYKEQREFQNIQEQKRWGTATMPKEEFPLSLGLSESFVIEEGTEWERNCCGPALAELAENHSFGTSKWNF